MSKTKRGAKQENAPKGETVAEQQQQDNGATAEQGKRIAVAGTDVPSIGATIGAAVLAFILNAFGIETSFRTIIDGALSLARKSLADGLEPELIDVRVGKLFAVARDAIVASLSEEARKLWDGYLPTANPSPNKADRKAKGLPSKDRLNARDVRVLARRAGQMPLEVRNAHDAYEATYNFASKVARIIEALLTVPDFAKDVERYQTRLSNGIDFQMSASALFEAARKATPRAKDDETEESATEEGAAVPDTRDAIIARTVAQLRAIGDDAMADAILAVVATVAAVAVEEVPAE